MMKARAKNGFNLKIVHFYIRGKLDIIPVLIHWILIGFEAILKMILLIRKNPNPNLRQHLTIP